MEYRVLLVRRPDDKQLNTWARGIVLEDDYRRYGLPPLRGKALGLG